MKPQLIFVIVFLATCSGSYGVNGSQKIREECLKPKNIGSCEVENTIERYYYDAAEGKCKQFIFGGCNKNSNNFLSEERCKDYCLKSPKEVCQQPLDQGTCLVNKTRFYYDAAEKKCVSFTFGGCKGNYNNFRTETGCQNFCGDA